MTGSSTNKTDFFMKKRDAWVLAVLMGLTGMLVSCEYNNNELGTDILPPGDNVIVYHDTIFEIDTYTMTGKPVVTSEVIASSTNKVMLLGHVQDTVIGKSTASVVTQFNTPAGYIPAANLEVDSLFFTLQVYDFIGDTEADLNLKVHEFTERIYLDTSHSYYSDYDVEGKYNPVPLVQQTITPEDGTIYKLLIEDQDFIDKFLAVESDTNLFYSDSVFKDYFNGFYITAEPVSSRGTMARVQFSSANTRLLMRYANDSTEVDSTAERDFKYANFTIDQFSSQKINVFEHDYTGTHLAEIVDDELSDSPYAYVQGMQGVNTRFSFASLQDWIDQNPIIINSATLVFDVVPADESGLPDEDLPDRLMIYTYLEGDSIGPVYDYFLIWANDPNQEATRFGGYKKADSEGLFSDTVYTYRFNMGLHFQSMLDGTAPDSDFILQLKDGLVNPKYSKLYSNLFTNERRIRLEIVYLKI
jgi:hypothetical protein